MVGVAERLGEDFGFARVDLYSVGESVLFGEICFGPGSGLETFDPPEMDEVFGDKWQSTPIC